MKLSRFLSFINAIKNIRESLTDETALNNVDLYQEWKPNKEYPANDRILYDGKLYRVIQIHTSQADWKPDITPALYTEVSPDGVIPVWKQPTGSHDTYMTGDKVHYPDAEGSVYVSLIDYNSYDPAVYGWEVVS